MRYLRLLLRVTMHERIMWVVCALCAGMLSLACFLPHWFYGGADMRSLVPTNLEILQTQKDSGVFETLPDDLRAVSEENLAWRQRAANASSPRELYDALARICQLDLRTVELGYGDGTPTNITEAEMLYCSQLARLADPPEYADSRELPAILYVSLAPASLPPVLALVPGVAAAWVVASCAGKRRLLGGQIARGTSGLLGRCLAAALVSIVLLLACMAVPAAISAIRNGIGDAAYPVVYIQSREVVATTAGGCAAWTVALLLLANCMIAVLGSCVSMVTNQVGVALVVSLVVALIPSWPQYFAGTSPLARMLPYLATSYFIPSNVVGFAGIVPAMDVSSNVRLDPVQGTAVIVVTSLLLICIFALVELVVRRLVRRPRHKGGA